MCWVQSSWQMFLSASHIASGRQLGPNSPWFVPGIDRHGKHNTHIIVFSLVIQTGGSGRVCWLSSVQWYVMHRDLTLSVTACWYKHIRHTWDMCWMYVSVQTTQKNVIKLPIALWSVQVVPATAMRIGDLLEAVSRHSAESATGGVGQSFEHTRVKQVRMWCWILYLRIFEICV